MNLPPITSVKNDGFALIATISVMVLLVMIALAMLSLSSIELRQSGNARYQKEAQANARMALMLAIGELQKYAGPDQRVTAESSILEDPTNSGSKIPNRHWTGAWRTDGFKGEKIGDPGTTPIISRNTDSSGSIAGSLVDRRAKEGDYIAKDQVMGWLVSQDSASPADPLTALPDGDPNTIRLVGPGSTSIPEEEVKVRRVLVKEKGKEKGGFAWWVGDEGVKARFNLPAKSEGLTPNQPWLAPAQQGINIARGYEQYESLSDAEVEKSMTRGSSDLSPASADGKLARLKHFHDLSFHSMGLITDTMRGGLRKDFSAFLAKDDGAIPDLTMGGITRKGLSQSTPLFDTEKLRALSPKLGLIHEWNKIGMARSSVTTSIPPLPPKNNSRAVSWGWNDLGGGSHVESSGIDLTQQDTPAIHPIMVDAGVSYGVSLKKRPVAVDEEGKNTYDILVHYYPRVVLWNPYNVKIDAARYVVQINMPHRYNVEITISKEESQTIQLTRGGDGNHIIYHRPHFTLASTSFEPGEALLFTADAGGASNGNAPWGGNPNANYYGATNLDSFTLSAQKTAPFKDNFYFNTGHTIKLKELKDNQIPNLRYAVGVSIDYEDYYRRHFFYKLYLRKGNASNMNDVRTDTNKFPPLQYIAQTENGSEATNCPWFDGIPVSFTDPLRLISNAGGSPYYRFKSGHRMQWLHDTLENRTIRAKVPNKPGYNTPYLGYNTIANHNPRAGWHIKSPVEVVLRASSAAGRYTHGILIDDPYGWNWKESSLDPVPVNGKNRVSPFGRPAKFGGQTFPMLDLPSKTAPLVSLAALQHAPLSQFAWHPMYAVGNSLADPRVPRDQSTHYIDARTWEPLGAHPRSPDRWGRIRQGHIHSELNESAFLYDLSYESNYALWDSYYLSSVPASGYTAGTQLPNPRMTVTDKSNPAELQDFHRSAKHLQIKGAFNINSTSETAWATLIASLRSEKGMKITLQDGSTLEANDVYSRLLHPYALKYENDDKPSENDDKPSEYDEKTWKGYRQLTDVQIRNLAREIVNEVKQRGPFLSIADFVNRRLVEPPSKSGAETEFTSTGLKGTLQAAIDSTGINTTLRSQYLIPKTEYTQGAGRYRAQEFYGSTYPKITFPLINGEAWAGKKPDHNHWADSKMVGAPAYLTQADLLQKWGSIISARSDTFVIRAYGDAKDASGKVTAKAWCEAVVQRVQQPLVPDAFGLDPETDLTKNPSAVFGRKFKIISFRWLNPSEV